MMNLDPSKKRPHRTRTVTSLEALRSRVERLLKPNSKRLSGNNQLALDLPDTFRQEDSIEFPTRSIVDFLNFLTDALPEGDVYLFGGVLRDLALLGARGFNSDIDLVVEGDWGSCKRFLEHHSANRNKFGGYRFEVAGWKIDIWNARETWAIRQGLVEYKDISSLTQTTVLNWDAILMNWRTRGFILRHNYLEDIQERLLDIVLEQNPDPMGMAVRVFRHLGLKDARSFTERALIYLANCTAAYNLRDLQDREITSYGRSVIAPPLYWFFENIKAHEDLPVDERLRTAKNVTELELGAIPLLTR